VSSLSIILRRNNFNNNNEIHFISCLFLISFLCSKCTNSVTKMLEDSPDLICQQPFYTQFFHSLINSDFFNLTTAMVILEIDPIEKVNRRYVHSIAKGFPKLSCEWHPTKNGKLTPNNSFPGSETKIWWIHTCSCGEKHEWYAPIRNRTLLSQGCPYCKG
jgi:hypothetical protein